MEQKTPLYDCHVECGGKMVPFGGFLLPVQYKTGIIAEHMAVRKEAGLFDVSHMGEIVLSGKDAFANIQMLLCNDFTSLAEGKIRYSPMCNEAGGIVDDLLVYRVGSESYLLVVNAANRKKDADWIKAHLTGKVDFKDLSDGIAQLALQGPNSPQILKRLADESKLPQKYYTFTKDVSVAGKNCLVSRTGYTGEDGFEIYCKGEDGPFLWKELLKAGADCGLIPCGLGARDTLRLEAAMPLYGHEMNDQTTPFEADLDFAIKMNKEAFIGKAAIEAKGPLTRKRVGLSVTGRGIAREECPVYAGGKKIGVTTSGTHCPYLNKAAAMAYLSVDQCQPGTTVEIEVRGRRISAEVTPLPFYRREK